MREDARTKGLRLLVDGRLFVREVNPATGYIYAECRGDSGEVYDLGWNPWKQKWGCTCPARTDCSHLRALWTVVTKAKVEPDAQPATDATQSPGVLTAPAKSRGFRYSGREVASSP